MWGVEVKVIRTDGTEADIDEPGEIHIRGHNVMKGYLDRPEATAEAIDPHGWFRTGDIDSRDTDGYLYIVDRTKDLIIRGGFNVYPRELEEVLHTHRDVSLAAVGDVPHASHGEEVKAFVVRKPGATATESDLVAWCKQHMAGHTHPRIIEFPGDTAHDRDRKDPQAGARRGPDALTVTGRSLPHAPPAATDVPTVRVEQRTESAQGGAATWRCAWCSGRSVRREGHSEGPDARRSRRRRWPR